MAKTIKYTGTQRRWPELAITGKQSIWLLGQQEERSDAEANLLLGTGLFTEVFALDDLPIASLVSGGVISTWANRAALVAANTFSAFFTDVGVGGSFWNYSGGRWRPSAGRVVLKNLTSSVTHNTTTRTVMDYTTIPAGLWQDGDIIDLEWCKTLTGTDTDTTETGLASLTTSSPNPWSTFGEAMNMTTAALTNSNPIVAARWRWRRLGATSVRPVSISGSVGLGTAGAIPSDPTITTNLDTTDAYLQISGKLTTGSGPVTNLRAHTVTLICGA